MPFFADDESENGGAISEGDSEINSLFEAIKRCEYDFSAESWHEVSPEAKDFVERILILDASKRMTCDEMLEHPWMKLDLEDKPLNLNTKKLEKYMSTVSERKRR